MIVAGIICGTVLVLWFRVEPFVDRLIQLREHGRENAPSIPTASPSKASHSAIAPVAGPVVIPDDLEALAMRESEPWAQDDLRDVIKERYRNLNDWQKVRRAMGIGELP